MKVAYLFDRYPVLTQRFLQREIDALRAHGIAIEPFSIFRHIAETRRSRWSDNYLSVIPAASFALRHARAIRAGKFQLVHGAWATAPATAAVILHRLCHIPFSFGAHAFDLYRHGGDPFLRAKLRAAAFVHTTTRANVSYLQKVSPESAAKIVLARRGLEEMPPATERKQLPVPVRILSVGRLVEKKGHRFQLAASEELRKMGIDFRLLIVGDGPLRATLLAEVTHRNLSEYVSLGGALSHKGVDEAFGWANIFWHTGIIDAAGDRDGLPNVIPEAMAHGLPVISHREPGAMEAVNDGVTGLTVESGDAMALAQATARVIRNRELRTVLGQKGRAWVEENFLAKRNAEILAAAFRRAVTND